MITALATTEKPAKQKRKGGAPKGNGNAIRHGLRGVRGPKGDRYIDSNVFEYRRELEAEVLDRYGKISVQHAEIIQTACEALRHSWRCNRWLKKDFDGMSHDSRRQYSRDALDALELRNKLTARLRGGGTTQDNDLDPVTKAVAMIREANRNVAAPQAAVGLPDVSAIVSETTQPGANGKPHDGT